MSTNAATSFDAITQIIARLERAAGAIGKAAVQTADADGTVRAELEVPIGGVDHRGDHPLIVQHPVAHDSDAITLQYTLDTTLLDAFEMVDISAAIREVTQQDGALVVTIGFVIAPYTQPAAGEELDPVDAALAAVRSPELRPYDDIPYLEELYDRCDTFAEMSERIEMDVSGETVRRYMIQAGIHEPATVKEPAETMELPDIELPGGVDPSVLVETVAEARTVHEVATRLEVDHRDCRRLLGELGVLDLVLCRMATADEAVVDPRMVCDRLRAKTTGGRA
mgnify:FL=1